ncbi:DUF3105 domain-containing protein [Cryptosporangium phraense]|uniref:DUF3105 domain-containing protein n=1 Tax=Cryptosporangium phraense TaxID=2593070 RepID=A0A545AHS8_9ACTN|nr:DUF3105 domain-containing protein [Cryptosporangium phraense]
MAGIVIGIVVVLLLCGGAVTAALLLFSNETSVDSDTTNANATIDGVVDYRTTRPDILTRQHVSVTPTYSVRPPVGGNHDATWQNCEGDVYANPIGDAHAVHSLEHGAVWITYRPDLPADQLESLKSKVTGREYTMLSPYPTLDQPISLQAWGYQLKVDSADDERIDQFLNKYRMTASIEPGAPCSNGTTASG